MNRKRRVALARRDLKRLRTHRPRSIPDPQTIQLPAISLDEPAEIEAIVRWAAEHRSRIGYVRAIGGCGCCVVALEVCASKAAIATLPTSATASP